MFRVVPGFSSAFISKNGEVEYRDGLGCTLPIADGKITIPIEGKVITVTLEWLWWFSFHRMYLSKELLDNIDQLEFVPSWIFSKKNPVERIPIFKTPIVVEGKYRIIGRFSRYAISDTGEVYDLQRRIIVTSYSEAHGYLGVEVWDGASSTWRTVTIHRMLGLAWIPNNDYVSFPVINHKNGIKHDLCLENLEWESARGNNVHAVLTGLRPDNIPCRVRSIITKEVHSFQSSTQAMKFMGFGTRVNIRVPASPARLLNNEFEVRLGNDNTPWFYEGKDKPIIAGRYILTLNYPSGEKLVFHDVRSMLRHLNVVNSWGKPVQKSISIIEAAIPGLKIKLEDTHGKNRGKVVSPSRRLCIEVENPALNKTLTFTSLRKAAEHFQVDRDVVNVRLKNGKDYQGWIFREKV